MVEVKPGGIVKQKIEVILIIKIPLFINFGDKNYGNITIKIQNTKLYIHIKLS